ncbi:MAG: 50S ribosomal protein L29 [Anaerolineae bacterium]|nr:50S ribosomal protein L29 [Thermoflexales bacterium]MDW8408463.1 50S ribosomal protein L29 [Anaerolineae bacterium]
MRFDELAALTTAELQKKLDDTYRELFNLRFQRAQNQLKDTNSIKRVRHDIARIKTVLRQRELAQAIRATQVQQRGEA